MADSKFLTQLNLSPDERLHPPPIIEKLKTLNEWAAAAIDAVKDNSSFLDGLKALSPWADAVFSSAKDSFAAVKFVTKIFDELTKIQEPEHLARLALTLSYQAAAEAAISKVGLPTEALISRTKLDDSVDDVDLLDLDPKRIDSHAFVQKADRILQHYLPQAGYSPDQIAAAIRDVHAALQDQFASLLSHGKTKDKFEPLTRWLGLPSDRRLSRAALRRHAEYTSWLFWKAPVLQREPYALGDVFIEAECSKLTYEQLKQEKKGRPKPNPYLEGEVNGGRHKLLETVMSYVTDPKFREPIVIQGSAGSGKSTFTLRLADHLRSEGFTPIRIRLRDVVLGKEFYTQFGEAIAYQNDEYLMAYERFTPASNPLADGAVLQDILPFEGGALDLCPYILILDGWDEISVAVSEGLKIRVKELLLRIRSELFRPSMRVRVILTGRPSDAIDDCTEFFRDQTPVLTIRILKPEELSLYAGRLRLALTERPLRFDGASSWQFPEEAVLSPIYGRYRVEFSGERREELKEEVAGTATVLGYPLLLHVTFRLLAEPGIDPKELIDSPAALLRKLTDFATSTADKPSDAEPGTKILARVSGMNLRHLLRKTAAFMSALGQEAISKDELKKRLRKYDVDEIVKGATQDNLISAMLVSFYFKGGNTDLGCEFTHKAIREYLFAEEIVEQLKHSVRSMPNNLSERPAHLYWKDFEKTDARHKASEDLSALLAPQWLTTEVLAYLGSLIQWEAQRCFSKTAPTVSTGETDGIDPEEWCQMATLLADLWDWWAEGVHLRPQPQIDENSGQLEWHRSSVERWIPRSKPFVIDALERTPEPIRSITLDAHLGDALFRLCAWVHFFGLHSGRREARRFQSVEGGKLRFRPGGDNNSYFNFLTNRINAGGWRPGGSFPNTVFAEAVDFSLCHVQGLSFRNCKLDGSLWRDAEIENCRIGPASLRKADLDRAVIQECRFYEVDLDGSTFLNAHLIMNVFVGGSIEGANFQRAEFGENLAYFTSAGNRLLVQKNRFCDTKGADILQDQADIEKGEPRHFKPR